MADIDVETSNAIFQALEDWNTILKAEKIPVSGQSAHPVGPKLRGPTP